MLQTLVLCSFLPCSDLQHRTVSPWRGLQPVHRAMACFCNVFSFMAFDLCFTSSDDFPGDLPRRIFFRSLGSSVQVVFSGHKTFIAKSESFLFFYILFPFRCRRLRLLLEVPNLGESLCKKHLSILAFERCPLLPFPVTWGSSAEPSLGNKLPIFDCTLVLFTLIRCGAERYRDNNCAVVFLWEHHYLKMKYHQLKLHYITVKGERI